MFRGRINLSGSSPISNWNIRLKRKYFFFLFFSFLKRLRDNYKIIIIIYALKVFIYILREKGLFFLFL